MDSQFAGAFAGRGTVSMSRNRLDAAIADFTRAIELNSQLSNAYMNRGLALVMQGNEAAAQKDFERALEIDPGYRDELKSRIAAARAWRQKR